MDRNEAEMIAIALEGRVTLLANRKQDTTKWEALARKYRQLACKTTPKENKLLKQNAKLSREALEPILTFRSFSGKKLRTEKLTVTKCRGKALRDIL